MGEKTRLATAGSDLKLWDIPGFSLANTVSLHSQPITSLAWGSNGNLASVGGDKVVVTSFKNGINNSTEIAVGDGYNCAAFNSTSRYLLLGGKTKSISVWDWKSKTVKKTYKEHKDAVSCLAFNWNDTSIASGALDGNILLHNVVTGQASAALRQPKTQAIRGLQYSYFKKSLLGCVSDDGALNMWDTNARKLITSFTNDHKAPATGLSFSPVNEMLLVSVGLDKKIVFYDAQGKKAVKVMTADAPLTAVDFLHDGITLAIGTTRGKICIYDLRSGSSPITTQSAHMSSVQCLKFEPQSSSKNIAQPASKVTKSVVPIGVKPNIPSRNLPEEPQGTQPLQSAVPQANVAAKPQFKQQNGVRLDEDIIFSPLQEAKTPMTSNSELEDKPIPPPVGFEQVVLGPTKDKTFDGSGIFSPLASNITSDTPDVRQHPVGGPAYSPTEFATPKTSAEPTPYAPRDQTESFSRNTDDATSSLQSLDRKQKYNGLRDIRTKLKSNKNGPDSIDAPPESLAPSLRVTSESSPTVSRHSSNSSDIRPWPDNDVARSEGRARLEGRADTAVGVAGSHGDDSFSLERGSARSSRSSSGGSPMQHRRRLSSGSSAEKRNGVDAPDSLHKGNAMGYANGDTTAHNAGLQPFQIEFIKNMIDESMDEFRVAIHRDVVNLQVEMLRQFQIQQNELREMMQKYSVNETLVQEINRLREENHRLKTKY